MQQKIIVEITVDWEDYQDVDPELIFEDTGMPSAAKEGVTYKVITPPSSHQGDFIRDMEAEVSKRYSDPESEFAQDFEIGASWAKEYLSQAAPPTPVEGPWHLKSHNNSEDDDTVWMTDGKLSIYIDEFNFDDFPEADYWLVNFLNRYQFKLSIDDQSPLIISHLEEQVKELQGRKGAVWVNTFKGEDQGWQLCRVIGSDKRMPMLITQNIVCDPAGKTYKHDQIEYLSDSPAPEQVHPIDFAEWLLTDGHINPARGPMICVSDLYDKYIQQLNC